ncbi:MFS transporter [Micromonospora inyonensis]|uniref:Predicted arabinose efflux permease, MFS family n=1 Tax=Micromonospora inyonensis TaxID=47866 RepID=A0A1C6RI63_9ACTN|nr:MFS transporter [Micromonospora inyonensis]SCL16740.1 Predicted arabinose efflux permease, MFS family [Micromonospora inyonensis]
MPSPSALSACPPFSRWSDVGFATVARGVSTCGDFLAATALTLALQSAGAGGLAVSALLLAATLPLVVLAPLTGRLADRVDSRTLLVGAGLAQAAVCLGLAYAGHPVLIVALVALLASGLAVTQPVLAALLPAMVRAEDFPRASAFNQTAATIGMLGGPALAGLLVGQFGTRVPLLVDAASYLALVLAGLVIRTRRGGSRSVSSVASGPDRPTPAWRLRSDPLLVAMVATMAAVVGALGALGVVEVFYLRETLDASATVFGVVTAAWPLGILPGAWLLARLAPRFTDDVTLLWGGLVLLAVCCLMVLAGAAVPIALLVVPCWLLGGVANGGDSVLNNLLLARRVPEANRGRAFAVFGGATQGAAMVGYLVGGLAMAVAEPRLLVAACGVAGLLVVAVAVAPVVRAVRVDRDAAGGAGSTTPTPAR